MSVYNETEEELRKAIESILDQTYSDIEFVIVNDNPQNERNKSILKAYAGDNRIILIENTKNLGLAISLNKGIDASHGEYIARMDADDIATKDRLQVELDYLIANKLDLVSGAAIYIDENGIPLDDSMQRKGYRSVNLANIIKYTNPIIHPTVLAKAEAFKDLGGYRNFPCAQDNDMWLRMATAQKKLGSTDSIVLQYRIRMGSISKKNPLKQYLTHNYGYKLYRERLKNNGCDSYSEENYKKYLAAHRAEDESCIRVFKKTRKYFELSTQKIREKNLPAVFWYTIKTCTANPYGYNMIYSFVMVGIQKIFNRGGWTGEQ